MPNLCVLFPPRGAADVLNGWRRIGILAAAVVATGCHDRTPLAPGVSDQVESGDHIGGTPGEGGTYQTIVPINNSGSNNGGWNNGAIIPWQQTGLIFSDTSLVEIKLEGLMHFAMGESDCPAGVGTGTGTGGPLLGLSLGPRGWQEFAHQDGEKWQYADSVRLRRPDGTYQRLDPSLITFTTPDTLAVGRIMEIGPGEIEHLRGGGGGLNFYSGPGIPPGGCREWAYNISGSRTLTVQETVPITVHVQGGPVVVAAADMAEASGSEPVDSGLITAAATTTIFEGDSVTFEAVSTYNYAPGQPTWWWSEGDTLAIAGNINTQNPQSQCNGQTTCTIAPSVGGGRMQVAANFTSPHGSAWNHSEVVMVDSAFAATVVCTPNPLKRASSTTCTATWTPASLPASSVYFVWKFDGDSVTIFPDTAALKWPPPPTIGDSAQGMSTWSGQIVHSGMVSVEARLGGSSTTSIEYLAVDARGVADSFGITPITYDSVNVLDLPTNTSLPLAQQNSSVPFDTIGLLGANVDVATLSKNAFMALRGSPQTGSVSSGPNAGLHYITHGGWFLERRIAMRTWLTDTIGGPFSYNSVQYTNRTLLFERRRLRGNQRMHRADSAEALWGLYAHEGRGRLGGRGHQGQMERAVASTPACGNVRDVVESLVAPSAPDLLFHIASVEFEGAKSIGYHAHHYFVHSNRMPGPFYQVTPGPVTVPTRQNPTPALIPDTIFPDAPDTFPSSAAASNNGCTRLP